MALALLNSVAAIFYATQKSYGFYFAQAISRRIQANRCANYYKNHIKFDIVV